MELSSGKITRLTADGVGILGLAWLPDGSGIVFASPRAGGTPRLWRVPVSGGTPEPITSGERWALSPAVAKRGNRLAYAVDSRNFGLWRIGLMDSKPRTALAATRMIHSTRLQLDPQ